MRALLSVSDKTGLVPFAQTLADAGVEILTTGGTHRVLREAGVPVVPVDQVTGAPEILGGRVKTLHPHIHGGILATASEEHQRELDAQGIGAIDLVVVNLYPFREVARRPGATPAEVLDQIDIGGPTMIRAAAKNHPRVTIVVDPDDYPEVGAAVSGGKGTTAERRRALARKAFAHVAAYDAAIVQHFDRDGRTLPPTLHLALERADVLRYGENPHQAGARYRTMALGGPGMWDTMIQHKGQALSYLNVFDADAAWRLVHAFDGPACAVVKHANPCGFALSDKIVDAYRLAYAGDPLSAFGGVVACNREVDEAMASALMENAKCDVLIAPAYTPGALERLASRRRAMRVLESAAPRAEGRDIRSIDDGWLVQDVDPVPIDRSSWRVVTEREPTEHQWRDLEVAWTLCAFTRSNAIVLVKDAQAVGVGAGQQSRVDAARSAAATAHGRAVEGACASDAFFPFRDGLDVAVAAGVSAVIQPGGSVRDDEVIGAAEEHDIAMVLTGTRHFRH